MLPHHSTVLDRLTLWGFWFVLSNCERLLPIFNPMYPSCEVGRLDRECLSPPSGEWACYVARTTVKLTTCGDGYQHPTVVSDSVDLSTIRPQLQEIDS